MANLRHVEIDEFQSAVSLLEAVEDLLCSQMDPPEIKGADLAHLVRFIREKINSTIIERN